MQWNSKEFKEWIAGMDSKISDDLRLVLTGMQHIDARIRALQSTCIYMAVVLTVILGVLVFR